MIGPATRELFIRHPGRLRTAAIAFATSFGALASVVVAGDLRITAPSPPGSGWDQLARALQAALSETGHGDVTVVNVPGQGGTAGLQQFLADGLDDAVLVTGLTMLDATYVYRSPVGLDRLMPVARLASEPFGLAVATASPLRGVTDMRALAAEDLARLTLGGGPSGSIDQVGATLLVQGLGADVANAAYVPFLSSQEGATAAAEGRVAAAFLPLGELSNELKAGRIRLLAIAAPERLEGLEVPTLRDREVALDLANWRGLLARPGLPPAARDRLVARLEGVRETKPWRDLLDQKRWRDDFLPGEKFGAFLVAEQARIKAALKDCGYLK